METVHITPRTVLAVLAMFSNDDGEADMARESLGFSPVCAMAAKDVQRRGVDAIAFVDALEAWLSERAPNATTPEACVALATLRGLYEAASVGRFDFKSSEMTSAMERASDDALELGRDAVETSVLWAYHALVRARYYAAEGSFVDPWWQVFGWVKGLSVAAVGFGGEEAGHSLLKLISTMGTAA